jgi:hypothetical protein
VISGGLCPRAFSNQGTVVYVVEPSCTCNEIALALRNRFHNTKRRHTERFSGLVAIVSMLTSVIPPSVQNAQYASPRRDWNIFEFVVPIVRYFNCSLKFLSLIQDSHSKGNLQACQNFEWTGL